MKKVAFPALKSDDGSQQFRASAYRWVILANFASVILNNAILTVGYAAIVSEISLAFGVASWWVLVLIAVPSMEFVPVSIGLAWLFGVTKTHYVVYLGALLQLVGGWLRMLSFLDSPSVVPLYVGTAVLALATPMSLNGISLIANLWFPDG